MLYVLIPLALALLLIAVLALVWAIRNRQFDSLEDQAWSVVLDDDTKPLERNERVPKDPVEGDD